jgi:hypothetical protein
MKSEDWIMGTKMHEFFTGFGEKSCVGGMRNSLTEGSLDVCHYLCTLEQGHEY